MKDRLKAALLTVSGALRKLLPSVLKGKEKAVVAFLTPIIVANLARFVPGVHVDPSLIEQAVLAFITSLTVYQAANK